MVDYVKHPRSVKMSLVKVSPIWGLPMTPSRNAGIPTARVSYRKGGHTVSLVKSLY